MLIKKRRALACNSVLSGKNHIKFVKFHSQEHPQNFHIARELHEKRKAVKIAVGSFAYTATFIYKAYRRMKSFSMKLTFSSIH